MPLSSTKDLTVGLQDPKMSQNHPDLAAEQAHIDHAYACLEKSKTDAWRIRDLNEASTGGTSRPVTNATYSMNNYCSASLIWIWAMPHLSLVESIDK
jgi:hypothetical protein